MAVVTKRCRYISYFINANGDDINVFFTHIGSWVVGGLAGRGRAGIWCGLQKGNIHQISEKTIFIEGEG